MVEAIQPYHKVLRTIDALMRYYARQEAKDQIRAGNQRVTDYDPRDISIMAKALLQSQPERFLERAGQRCSVGLDARSLLAEQLRRSSHPKGLLLRFECLPIC
jgi:hypothetical protein